MSKLMLKLLACFIFTVPMIFIAVSADKAMAFCIYNNNVHSTSGYGDIEVIQTSGHKFGRGYHAKIKKGDRGCVNWSDSSVNTSGKKDSTLRFDVYYLFPNSKVMLCNNFPIKAGGWMTVKHEAGWQWNDSRICKAFY
ncbi:hypothetical protein SAMN05660653_02532 [Desulfonatronum thiosulfatophilum]|uniref:Uncharacterized protein n=1 Tax=Desulfonatronum thiosulfatophilum TaxID=617002 RepID=A0A1G6E1U6_9BACT|nr:hypothetical protein [Desulfonatronum thiosulfatophilum]SDB51342.1 hypothetical protein SAMN05660653_02532 [Desulfonatronum thiosulfatophilum]